MVSRPLTAKEQVFVAEYAVDLDYKRAALAAGYKRSTAEHAAYAWAKDGKVKPHVFEAIQARLKERGEVAGLTQEWVLQKLKAIADAKVHDLVQHRRACCRHCYGQDFKRMETPAERAARFAAYLKAVSKAKRGENVPAFDPMGGVGFDKRKQPNPDCPECFGEGDGDAFIPDTRDLTPAQLAVYGGAKRTKEGVEIKFKDQEAAVINIGKHLGMFKDNVSLTGNVTVLLQDFKDPDEDDE